MFTTLIGTLQLSFCGAIGLMAGVLAEVSIDHNTHIPLGLTCSLVVSGIMAAMWLSRSLTRLEDKIESLDKRMNDLHCVRQSEKETEEKKCDL